MAEQYWYTPKNGMVEQTDVKQLVFKDNPHRKGGFIENTDTGANKPLKIYLGSDFATELETGKTVMFDSEPGDIFIEGEDTTGFRAGEFSQEDQ